MIKGPEIISRNVWEAAPFKGTTEPLGTIEYIVIHHSAGLISTSKENSLNIVKKIQTFHQETRNWSDIGYHFLVDNLGNIFQGRPLFQPEEEKDSLNQLGTLPIFAMGAHVAKQNKGKLGICLLGNFQPSAKEEYSLPNDLALLVLAKLIVFICMHYAVSPDNICGHKDFLTTECPGDSLYQRILDIKAYVKEQLNDSLQLPLFPSEHSTY